MLNRVLITGVTGFVGPHLAREVLAARPDIELWGLVRWRSSHDSIKALEGRLKLIEGDLHDSSSIRTVIERLRPDGIIHLASQSSVTASWSAPSETFQTNLLGTLNLFEAARGMVPAPRIVFVGSSEEYGEVAPEDLPVDEFTPLRPISPYAVSKAAADLLGYQAFRSYSLPVIRVRAFNHTGPGRGEQFAISNFCRQFALMKLGKIARVLRVGNLEAARDFLDVRDVAAAYRLALETGKPGEVYVVSSGESIRMSAIPEKLTRITGIEPQIEVDPERLRPSDISILKGNSSRFRALTGWAPSISIERTLEDLYQDWLSRLAAESAN